MKRTIMTVLCIIAGTNLSSAQVTNPLFIPELYPGVIDGSEERVFELDLHPDKTYFFPGDSTSTYGISSPNVDHSILGPTLYMEKGDVVRLEVTNNLMDTSTMHWHGFHVDASNDGGPMTKIPPGTTWKPQFTSLDYAATYWYHPHLHHHTEEQVVRGAAAMIIVRDSTEMGLDLPRTYGVDEFPLVFQDRRFDAQNQIEVTGMGDTMMVNGTMNPHLNVLPQNTRFRMLNGSSERPYFFQLQSAGGTLIPFAQIASDGGLLENTIFRDSVSLTNGERLEFVVDFAGWEDSTINLIASPFSAPTIWGWAGTPGNFVGAGAYMDSNIFQVLELKVGDTQINPTGPVPLTLTTWTIPSLSEVDRYRTQVMNKNNDTACTGPCYQLNYHDFNMHVPDDTVYLDDIEVWTIVNTTTSAHPFHIHDVQFYLLSRNGAPPQPWNRGRKDDIFVNGLETVEFIATFDVFHDPDTAYMYHCHILPHEDGGMMGSFIVIQDPLSELDDLAVEELSLNLYPNPTSGFVTIKGLNTQESYKYLRIFNSEGRIVKQTNLNNYSGHETLTFDLTTYSEGMYYISIEGDREYFGRLIKQ